MAVFRAGTRITRAQWILFAWLISGIVCFLIGFDLSFLPSRPAEVGLVVASLVVGVLIVARNYPTESIRGVSRYEQFAFLVIASVMLSLMSVGNIYMGFYAVHMISAQESERAFTVLYKKTDLDLPGRCKYYVRFRDTPFLYFRKACVSREGFESIVVGSEVAIRGTESPFGFKAEAIKLVQSGRTTDTRPLIANF